jgi:hypothetical protein
VDPVKTKSSSHTWSALFTGVVLFTLSACQMAGLSVTPTYFHHATSVNGPGYTHFAPSKGFNINIEFDYPKYWLRYEYSDETGGARISLDDPGILTLPTPDFNMHPVPHDFGSVFIWVMYDKSGQTPASELAEHKQIYSEINRMKVLGDYKITIDGREAHVLEYQVDDLETSPSLMFSKRIYFDVNGKVYEIMFAVAEKDRGGEFEKGFDYFLKSINIIP